MAARNWLKFLFLSFLSFGLILAWGYWHSMTYAALNVRVDDDGMKTDQIAYGTPHNVTLVFRGPANEQLVLASSVEPSGYIAALHPDAAIGNCAHLGARADYAACYRAYSAWSSTWAGKVRTADVSVGSCELKRVPVGVAVSNSEWLLWWVPLPHIGGVPHRYFQLVVRINSRECTAATR